MPELSRRRLLATGAVAAGAAVVGIPAPAAAAPAASRDLPTPYGDLRDIKHVVILMQENRSFDHYFGMMSGVRGFGDRSTVVLPGGYSVFQQPTTPPGSRVTATHYPWHLSDSPPSSYPSSHQPPSSYAGAQSYLGTTHNWDDQHGAWSGGWMNGWVWAKNGLTTLGYLDRADIPFQYALADAYTIGDAYHSSALSSTGPNRTYLWSGTIDPEKKHGQFTAYAGGDERHKNLLWESYAETLQAAGVTWKVYQCVDHFNDNGLEYFQSFAAVDPTQGGTATPGNPLYDNGIATVPEPLTGLTANPDNLAAAIRADVLKGTLPQVSWVVPDQAFSEHPDGAPNDGAYLIQGILNALNANPDVLNSTLLIINYDENDGQFDHVPPPVAPPGTPEEWFQEPRNGGYLYLFGPTGPVPIGLGFRVPLILVSPWTRGGWVTSEVSDHTSIIQFLEQWTQAIGTPATCPNISDWRRRVCGDLTRALDFTAPVYGLPELPTVTAMGDPSGGGYQPSPADNAMPQPESGSKRARPLPYQPNANLDGIALQGDNRLHAQLSMSNIAPHTTKASHFAVYNNVALNPSFTHYPTYAPSQYTIDPVTDDLSQVVEAVIDLGHQAVRGAYDVTVVGPNRFLRRFTGNVVKGDATSTVHVEYYPTGLSSRPVVQVNIRNRHRHSLTFSIQINHYAMGNATTRITVPGHGTRSHTFDPLRTSSGWYDFTVRVGGDASWSRRYIGHLETGDPSITGS